MAGNRLFGGINVDSWWMTMAHWRHLQDEAKRRIANAGIDLEAGGSVLFNGWSTLREGPLYLMGLDPGGDPEQGDYMTIGQQLDNMGCHYSTYETEEWEWRGHLLAPGQHPHQKRVRAICAVCKLKAHDVFAANAIFKRSRDTKGVDWTMWPACWLVHQWFLSIVQPRLVICLGNDKTERSSFGLLRSTFGIAQVHEIGRNFLDGRYFEIGGFGSSQGRCTLLGVPHPSRFKISAALEMFISGLFSR